MTLNQYLGLIAGVFQLTAYLVYIRYFLKDKIRPNYISWVMFAYGTSLMLLLEWQGGATWDLLVLPAVCAAMSIVIAATCFQTRPRDATTNLEKGAFAADLGLTIGYLWLRGTQVAGPFFIAGFILVGNLTTVTAFLPILLSTWKSPDNEKAAPWVFWTIGYTFLTASTLVGVGFSAPSLLLYPMLNLFIHGAMATFILKTPRVDRTFLSNQQSVYVALSQIEGLGMFAARSFGKNELVCVLTGPHMTGPVPMEIGPNWVGIGKEEWIDPDDPVDHLNHSCSPNAAFSEGLILRALRPIARDEEITMDYSTTEADLTWRMSCACGVPTCRKTLTSIQTAFADATHPPPALPAMQKIWYETRSVTRSKAKTTNQTQVRVVATQDA